MKKFLYNLFGKKFNKLKHSDKYKHAILGTLIYLGVWGALDHLWAFGIVYAVAIITESYDYVSKKGTPEAMDGIWTVVIPTILFLLWQI